jgi:hypothetical protein
VYENDLIILTVRPAKMYSLPVLSQWGVLPTYIVPEDTFVFFSPYIKQSGITHMDANMFKIRTCTPYEWLFRDVLRNVSYDLVFAA